MATLQNIARRIRSVESTRQITSTMEMVARTKIPAAQKRVMRAKPFARVMREMMSNMTDKYAEPVPLALPHDEIKVSVIIAITSDRGLAGHFNIDILRQVERMMAQCAAEGKEVRLIACGKTAINYFSYRGVTPVISFRDLSADPEVEQADVISDYLVSRYLAGEIDECWCYYNHMRNVRAFLPVVWRLMPIDMSLFEEHRVRLGSTGLTGKDPRLQFLSGPIEYEPSREYVLESLLPEYLSGYLYYMLINSAAAEQMAREAAMKNATDNTNEILDHLHIQYNRLRQDAITTEINEIVGGAEALGAPPKRRRRHR